MHRPSNVDDEQTLRGLIETVVQTSERLPIVFRCIRAQARIEQFGLKEMIAEANIVTTGPLGYMELLGLMSKAKLV